MRGEKTGQRMQRISVEMLKTWEPSLRRAIDELGEAATSANVAQHLGMPPETLYSRLVRARNLGLFEVTLVPGRRPRPSQAAPRPQSPTPPEPEPVSDAYTLPQASATSSGRAFVARFMHRFPVGGASQDYINKRYPLEVSHG